MQSGTVIVVIHVVAARTCFITYVPFTVFMFFFVFLIDAFACMCVLDCIILCCCHYGVIKHNDNNENNNNNIA